MNPSKEPDPRPLEALADPDPAPDSGQALLDLVWTPHKGQREFLDADAQFRVLACGRQWGKTAACAADLFRRLVRAALDPNARPEIALVVGPSLERARAILDVIVGWVDELRALGAWPAEGPLAAFEFKGRDRPQLRIGVHTITARTAKNPYLLRGQRASHIVVDEAAFLPDATITDVLLPMLAAGNGERGGRLTLLSTPNGRNYFAQMFDRGVRAFGTPDAATYWCKNAPSVESPHVSGFFLRMNEETMSQRSFEVEFGAQFHDAPGAAFRGVDVDAAIATEPLEEAECVPNDPVVVGVDWARTGDATAFVAVRGHRDGARVLEIHRHHGLPFTEQRERLAELLVRYPNAHVYADDTGLGKPVNELLNDPGSSFALGGKAVQKVVFTPRSKADLVAALQIALERRRLALPNDPGLRRELLNYAVSVAPSGGTTYGASAGHDDLVCALMLAVAHLNPANARPLIESREKALPPPL